MHPIPSSVVGSPPQPHYGGFLMTTRAWLQASRIHTASLTIPGTLLGVVAAGHTEPVTLLLFGLWALLYHAIGFLDNNVCDLEHDRRDPAKAHFALVTGEVPVDLARAIVLLGTIGVFAFGLNLLHDGLAFAFLAIAIAAGLAYNRLSKRTLLAPLFICSAFASLPAFAYFAVGGRSEPGVGLYVVAYAWFLMLHQIAWSGYVKDLASDQVNLLDRLGSLAQRPGYWGTSWRGRPYDGKSHLYDFSRSALAWGFATRAACPILAFAWVTYSGWSAPAAAVWIVALLGAFFYTARSGPMLRSRKVLWMSLGEVSAYFLLLSTLQPLLGAATVLWYVLPLGWYAFWNTTLWGSLVAPRV